MNKVKMYIENDVIVTHKQLFNIGKKAFIVTGKSSATKSGALEDVINVLKINHINYTINNTISSNPTVSSCIKASKQGFDCDFVIGIGGGSCLDAAKAIAVFIANENLTEEMFYQKKWKNYPLDIILIGTTAGTGSEVTKVAVLTDSEQRKHSIHDDKIYAKYSFGDPKYTLSLDFKYTISTAIDAISHAVESYFSNKANDESRNYSIKCIKEMYPVMLSFADNVPLTLKQRRILYQGSIDGGYAIDITGTTFAHNVGYYLTEKYNIPHGLACAYFLNDVFEYQINNNPSYALNFFENIQLSYEQFKKLFELLPDINIVFSNKEIDELLPRFENNNSIKNTYGIMKSDDVKEILLKHSKN